jgi:hypothetical protein
MTTVTQIKEKIQRLLGERANEIARETHFVQRESKLGGSDFVQGLVFGWLHAPAATTEDLTGLLQRRDVSMSASGLCQRFTAEAATLLFKVLEEVAHEDIQAEQAVPAELLSRFDAVIAEDSSTIPLPEKLKDHWPGCGGGQGQSAAGLKIHVRWDLQKGGLDGPLITPARQGDQSSALRQQGIAAGVLNITDESYCSLQWLKEQPGYFLSRPRSSVQFLDPQSHQRLSLSEIGPQVSNGSVDLTVLVGLEACLPARLILLRVPEEIIEQRRKRLREEAKRRGRAPNAQALERAQWTILITNVPADKLSIAEVIVVQRARWQIERLFRLWKEGGKIDEWHGRKPWRILCEIYAKLIAMVLQNWLFVLGTWQDPYRSLFKAAKQVREYAPDLLSALNGEISWSRLLTRLVRAMQACRVHRRRSYPCHAQLVLEGLDWELA